MPACMAAWTRESRQSEGGDGELRGAVAPAAGRRTLTDGLQRMAAPPQGSGQPLPEDVRVDMERSFATDFSSVRLHLDPGVRALGAVAYAKGDDVTFAPDAYEPHAQRGRELVGHELAHVVQQRGGRTASAQPSGALGGLHVDQALEAEADRAGARAAHGEPAGLAAGPSCAAGGAIAQPFLIANAVNGAPAVAPAAVNVGMHLWEAATGEEVVVTAIQPTHVVVRGPQSGPIIYRIQDDRLEAPADRDAKSPTATIQPESKDHQQHGGTMVGFRDRPGGSQWRTEVRWGGLTPGIVAPEGTWMEATRLGPDHPLGTDPTEDTRANMRRMTDDTNQKAGAFVAGHLLNDNLGGPGGDPRNIVALPKQVNVLHSKRVEEKIKQVVNDQGLWVYYRVEATHGPAHDAPANPTQQAQRMVRTLRTEWNALDGDGRPTGLTHQDTFNVPQLSEVAAATEACRADKTKAKQSKADRGKKKQQDDGAMELSSDNKEAKSFAWHEGHENGTGNIAPPRRSTVFANNPGQAPFMSQKDYVKNGLRVPRQWPDVPAKWERVIDKLMTQVVKKNELLVRTESLVNFVNQATKMDVAQDGSMTVKKEFKKLEGNLVQGETKDKIKQFLMTSDGETAAMVVGHAMNNTVTGRNSAVLGQPDDDQLAIMESDDNYMAYASLTSESKGNGSGSGSGDGNDKGNFSKALARTQWESYGMPPEEFEAAYAEYLADGAGLSFYDFMDRDQGDGAQASDAQAMTT